VNYAALTGHPPVTHIDPGTGNRDPDTGTAS
jgi:hypothetical protein